MSATVGLDRIDPDHSVLAYLRLLEALRAFAVRLARLALTVTFRFRARLTRTGMTHWTSELKLSDPHITLL